MIDRTDIFLRPDPTRVLVRFFSPGSPDRTERVVARVMALDDRAVEQRLRGVLERFEKQHVDLRTVFMRHYEVIADDMITDLEPSVFKKHLIGAYFTSEYTLESAALCNPSIVPHPDQSGLPEGSLRFVLSLRAVGEGHVSSIEFREGVIDAGNRIEIAASGPVAVEPGLIENPSYEVAVFRQKLRDLMCLPPCIERILGGMGETFSLQQLKARIAEIRNEARRSGEDVDADLHIARELAEQNYSMKFAGQIPTSERVIFPRRSHHRRGVEDARFVPFQDDESGERSYYATYTAYDGRTFLPQLLQTRDFLEFEFATLNGDGVMNKGMALFPRKIRGKYAMLSRQDGENIFLMFSEQLHFWYDYKPLLKPSFSWEYVQLGNCGSPIETPEGWLVLTHGVGPMRRYCIGAVLLDLDDPQRVIGRLREPLIEPLEEERSGYVPNVVYTCGALVHGGVLVVPYGVADYATRIALVDLDALLHRLKTSM